MGVIAVLKESLLIVLRLARRKPSRQAHQVRAEVALVKVELDQLNSLLFGTKSEHSEPAPPIRLSIASGGLTILTEPAEFSRMVLLARAPCCLFELVARR
jgi:hypothetical protein